MIEIYADSRETRSGLLKTLSEMEGYSIKVGELPCGDYAISSDVCIERKSATDFVISIMDGRLMEQIAKMKIDYKRPILLIEGNPFKTRSAIKTEALVGAISWVNAIEDVTVLMVADEGESAKMIATMARHLQQGLGYEVPLRRNKPKASDLGSVYNLEGLPGVGPKTAQNLFNHFGSIFDVCMASVEELSQVPRLGKASAERIYNQIRHRKS
ncbi:Fanconi anemia group M protein [Pseudomonas nitritireducens]|uniref:Fanconi anemia group M protein n=1 Tax=Pseudomonas nitroreducens TaxID=46680 RepID=A0A7W7KM33_PSENT|nr:ERCC4 domain-containing protein [Pseudomonas nitritireducens]MBB4865322.1 Fanconi anemia group M protein [Pseudomonas nitritireducens]